MHEDELIVKYRALFEQVENKRNWKLPINAEIELSDDKFPDMIKAIQFFTGSRDVKITPIDETLVTITAEGYYNANGRRIHIITQLDLDG